MLLLQGYTNYQLDRSKGTVAQVPNQAPPFMGVNPNGQYRSYAGQAPAPANMAASQASKSQQQVSNPTVQCPCSTCCCNAVFCMNNLRCAR